MRRRDFIGLAAGAAVSWPLARRESLAQERVRRIGLLTSQSVGSQEGRDRFGALRDGLRKLGWVDGRNLKIEVRGSDGDDDRLQSLAAELVRLDSEVLVASATTALVALQRATKGVPIVFAQVTDPVGAGFVASLSRPGGNITGFTQHEFSIGVKWLELIKELAPQIERLAVLFDPDNPAASGYLAAIIAGSPSFQVQVTMHPLRGADDIERTFAGIASRPNSGLVILPGPGPSVRRDLIVTLADRHRLPAVYPFRYWVASGGLAFYGIDNVDLHRRAATYVDRILKGEKPANLPIQHATKFELVINLRTAKALGLEPPISLLARTDEVIE
jgi:putative ABC transport system substrate-binding protein